MKIKKEVLQESRKIAKEWEKYKRMELRFQNVDLDDTFFDIGLELISKAAELGKIMMIELNLLHPDISKILKEELKKQEQQERKREEEDLPF